MTDVLTLEMIDNARRLVRDMKINSPEIERVECANGVAYLINNTTGVVGFMGAKQWREIND